MSEQNAYSILNVRKGCTEHEIKLAYVELVKRYDPEKHTERFMIIQSAYERLRDPKKRAKEDVFTFNFPKGEFQFLPEEKDAEPLPDVNARVRDLEEKAQQNPGDTAVRTPLIASYMKRSYKNAQKKGD